MAGIGTRSRNSAWTRTENANAIGRTGNALDSSNRTEVPRLSREAEAPGG